MMERFVRGESIDLHDIIQVSDKNDGVEYLPADISLAGAEMYLVSVMSRETVLKRMLSTIKDEYDYCLIDCSPSISILNINGLVASDEVYIPLRCDGNSCIGMAITMNLIRTVQTYNPTLQLGGCFLTQFDGRKNVAKTVYELLKNIITEDLILPFTIGNTKYLEENTFEQKPLLAIDSGKNKCSATLSYLKLTEYMIAPSKKEYIKKYKSELQKIDELRKKEETDM